MSKIVLGKSDGKNASLDLDILLRTHLLIWASTGGGKSWLIRRIAEQSFGKIPVIIVDREGEFSSLREKFGYVLVGKGGETPADPRSAKLVAEKLLELRASAVCDIFELKNETRHEWVKNFYTALVECDKKLWRPTLVILDEAHSFAPEKGQGESTAYGAVVDFAGVARKRQFANLLATQRLSKLSKNATAEMYNQAAGPTAQQADRDRASYEMGVPKKEQREFTESLRTIEPGHFFFQGRAVSMDRILVAVGGVETHHGATGQKGYAFEVPPAPEVIKKMLPKLADLPKAAEEKARTEAEFKKEIRSLRAQLKATPKKTVTEKVADPRAVERAVKAATADAQKVVNRISRQAAKYAGVLRHISEMAKVNLEQEIPTQIAVPKIEHANVEPSPRVAHVPSEPKREFHPENNGVLKNPEKRVLRALAEFEAIGVTEPSRQMIASWCGVKAGTGTFKNYLSRLRVLGFIQDGTQDRLRLTLEGHSHAPEIEAVVDTEDLLNRSAQVMGGRPADILRMLHEAHGEYVSREAIADKLGIKADTGTFKNYISELRTAGMLEDGPDKTVKASDWIFL